jgi:DNA-binding transcriptional regulator YdaS (Cro superfamily)
MKFKTYIERAEKTAGSQTALAALLGQSPSRLRDAKSGQRGLPVAVCYQIAELIGASHRKEAGETCNPAPFCPRHSERRTCNCHF